MLKQVIAQINALFKQFFEFLKPNPLDPWPIRAAKTAGKIPLVLLMILLSPLLAVVFLIIFLIAL